MVVYGAKGARFPDTWVSADLSAHTRVAKPSGEREREIEDEARNVWQLGAKNIPTIWTH